MNPAFPHTSAGFGVSRNQRAKPNTNPAAWPVSYGVVAELAVGYSMIMIMLAYVMFSSGVVGQII